MKHSGLNSRTRHSCRPGCSGKGRCTLPVQQSNSRGRCHAEAPKPSEPNGDDDFDIDEVVRKLSSEASRMREQEAQQSSEPSFEPPAIPQEQSPESLVGEPRFMANDFVIYDKLGSLNVRTVEQSSVQASLDETLRKGSPTATVSQKVNIYSATYESGKPFQGPVTVLLKEYTPDTRKIGVNELVIANTLQSLPEDAELWKSATADVSTTPISTVLGWFESYPVESLEDTTLMNSLQPATNQSLWLVCKFEGMQPAQAYLVAPVSEPAMKLPFMLNSVQRRHKMLRSIWTGCLNATAYVHAEGVVHESIGLGAFMMSTVDDAQADRLFMKLDNFGVSKAYTGASGPDSALAQGIKQDMEALAITLCELTFGSLVEADPNRTAGSSSTSAVAFQRLLLEVFQRDVSKFREYCLDVEEFNKAVAFLDEVDEGGWGILDMLLQGSSSCQNLTEAPFLNV